MDTNTLIAQLEALKAENEALKAAKSVVRKERVLSCKITEKGGLSVYGLGRFPVTLYKTQWIKLIAFVDTIKSFMVEHDAELTVKENKAA